MSIWQCSEHAPWYNYQKVVNIPRLWIGQVSPYASVTQPEYAWIWLNKAWTNCSDYVRVVTWSNLHRVLNMLPVLNTPGLGIWQGCEYVKIITQVTGVRSFCKLITYLEPCQRSKIDHFGKIIIAFNCFCKTLSFQNTILNHWEVSEHVSGFKNVWFWIFQDNQYARVFQDFQGYTRFTYFCEYGSVLNRHHDAIIKVY